MALFFDLHVHTNRYSSCSYIDPNELIDRAVEVGLDGLVITEHHHQWSPEELEQLIEESRHPGFRLFAGFEYSSNRGDILIYGLEPEAYQEFTPGMPPEEAAALAVGKGGLCIAAHPTRTGLSFDTRLATLPMVAFEVCSGNMQEHERRLAETLAKSLGFRGVACSDAHQLADVGRYATEFEVAINSYSDLQAALAHGRFRIPDGVQRRVGYG